MIHLEKGKVGSFFMGIFSSVNLDIYRTGASSRQYGWLLAIMTSIFHYEE